MPSDVLRTGGAMPSGKRRFPYVALIAWVFFALVLPWAAQSLSIIEIMGFPLGFFMAAQGSLIALFLIGLLSARRQNRRTASEEA